MPLSFCVYSLVIIWYALHGHHRDDLDARRHAQPWYRHKDDSPSKTCSPNSAEPFSQHKLQALPQLSPTPTNTATTNWPAPQPPRNCETQVLILSTQSPFGDDVANDHDAEETY